MKTSKIYMPEKHLDPSGIGSFGQTKKAEIIYVERQRVCGDGVIRPFYEPSIRVTQTIHDGKGTSFVSERPIDPLIAQNGELKIDRHGKTYLKLRSGDTLDI